MTALCALLSAGLIGTALLPLWLWSVSAMWQAKLFSLDPWVVLLIFLTVGVLAGAIVHVALTKINAWLSHRNLLAEHHEIASHFVGVVGVIYAVLVAFVVVTAWQGRDHIQTLTLDEQHNVDDLFHLDDSFDPSDAKKLRLMLRYYTLYTQAQWYQMRDGRALCLDSAASSTDICLQPEAVISARASELAHCIRESTFRVTPRSRQQEIAYQEGIEIVQRFSENRGERELRYTERTLQPILWLSFIVGALILVGMTYLVAGQDRRSQFVRTVALFSMMGMMIALALVFDRPFSGQRQISPDTWKAMLTHFDADLQRTGVQLRGASSGCNYGQT